MICFHTITFVDVTVSVCDSIPEMVGAHMVASADPRRTCSLVEKTYLGRRAHVSHSVVSFALLAPLLYVCGPQDSVTQMQKAQMATEER